MAMFADPFELLVRLQQALDSSRTSDWLDAGPSAGGSFPAINAFRKGEDYVLIAELPGVDRADLDIQVKGNTIRLAGKKAPNYPEKAGLHRRERPFGRFDRAVTLPIEVDGDKVQANYQDGVLALLLPRAERDKPRRIPLS
ncbi:MAG TPA: Hsp20/alpha crystallin family protein [Candidatus Margulisiibacteriota bacterium]|nr:Hsp20/alpha crystallin family protein [Candidatus Margulisiibacteriota bacterium]